MAGNGNPVTEEPVTGEVDGNAPEDSGAVPVPEPDPDTETAGSADTSATGKPGKGDGVPVGLMPVTGMSVGGLGSAGRPCTRPVACGGWPRAESRSRSPGLRWPAAVVAAAACWAVAGWGVAWRAGCRRPSVAVLPVAVGRGLVRGRRRRVLLRPVPVGFPPRRRAGVAVRGRLRPRRCGAGVRRRPAWNSVVGVVTAGRMAVTRLPVRLAAVGGGAVPRTGGRTVACPPPVSPLLLVVVPVTAAAVTVGLVRSPVSSGVLTALPRPVATG